MFNFSLYRIDHNHPSRTIDVHVNAGATKTTNCPHGELKGIKYRTISIVFKIESYISSRQLSCFGK